jgi:RNA polymerase sigma-70 factor, ECF subfamily
MDLTESELGRAVLAGQRRAEEEFVRRFEQRVHRMLFHALGRRADCEDLANEILQAVLANLRTGSFRGECQLSTFVHAVAQNKIREYLRRRRPESVEPSEEIPDPAPSPEERAARAETVRAVRAALSKLRPRHREVLFLFYCQELTVGEIAARLHVPSRRVSEWKEYALTVLRTRSGSRLEKFR